MGYGVPLSLLGVALRDLDRRDPRLQLCAVDVDRDRILIGLLSVFSPVTVYH